MHGCTCCYVATCVDLAYSFNIAKSFGVSRILASYYQMQELCKCIQQIKEVAPCRYNSQAPVATPTAYTGCCYQVMIV